jgi:cytochrome c oxidase assembly protein subunit 15
LANLVANVVIVVSGGAVRLTGSGLGCPTWPRCTDGSYVPTREVTGHGLIEFGNRSLAPILTVLTLATLTAAVLCRPRRRPVTLLAAAAFGGIPAQIVLGGITVRTHLNPWAVGAHFLLSAGLIAVAVQLWQRTRETSDAPARPLVRREVRLLANAVVALAALTLVLGAVVTGSGPHSGDGAARRTGLDPVTVTQLHADVVMLLIGLSVGALVAVRLTSAPPPAVTAANTLVGVEASQALIGYTQHFTHLPIVLVGLHMLGACLVWIAALRLPLTLRERPTAVALPHPDRAPEAEAVRTVGLDQYL